MIHLALISPPSSSINPLWLNHPTTPSYTPGFKASTINTLAGLAFSGHSDQCGYPVQCLPDRGIKSTTKLATHTSTLTNLQEQTICLASFMVNLIPISRTPPPSPPPQFLSLLRSDQSHSLILNKLLICQLYNSCNTCSTANLWSTE